MMVDEHGREGTSKVGLLGGVILVLIFLAVAEFAADVIRVAYRWQWVRRPIAEWKPDDYLKGRFVAGQRVVTSGQAVSINKQGFRGPETRGTSRVIACIGDSVTFGWHATKDETTYPYLLGRLLEAEEDLEVINAGMPRWNTFDLLDLYVAKVVPLRPGIVILLAGWNDIGYELAPPHSADSRAIGTILSDTLSLPRVIREVRARLWERGEREILAPRDPSRDEIDWSRLDEYERALRAFVTLVRSDDGIPILVTLPHFLKERMSDTEMNRLVGHLLAWPDLSLQGWRQMVQAVNHTIREIGRETHTQVVDCESRISSEHFTDIAHLDDRGNAILAACVAQEVTPIVQRPATDRSSVRR
jgi:lysophospholipase L1-like esterase